MTYESILYVADSIDILQNGRQLLSGLYADRVVVLTRPAEVDSSVDLPLGMAKLSLMLTLIGVPVGEHVAEIDVISPSGTRGVTGATQTTITVAEAGGSTNLIINATPFVVPEPGVYTVWAKIGDEVSTGSLEVRLRNPDGSPYVPGKRPDPPEHELAGTW